MCVDNRQTTWFDFFRADFDLTKVSIFSLPALSLNWINLHQVFGFHKQNWGFLSSHSFNLLLIHFSVLMPRSQANYNAPPAPPTEHSLWLPVWTGRHWSQLTHVHHSGMLGMRVQPCEKRSSVTSLCIGLLPSSTNSAYIKSKWGKSYFSLPAQTYGRWCCFLLPT